MKVKINDELHILRYVDRVYCGYEYMIEGNKSCHIFPMRLETQIGKTFRMSGNKYKIIGRRNDDK